MLDNFLAFLGRQGLGDALWAHNPLGKYLTSKYKIYNMPINLAKNSVNVGRVVYQWKVNEYEKYDRSKRWYLVMGILAVLLLLYAVVTANYIFALILVLFGIVLFLHEMQDPLKVSFTIVETGVVVGDKYYKFSELTSFWIIYNPPAVKNLYFSTNSLLKNRLQVPLLDYDPRPIRDFLNRFLKEDLEQEDEPLSDRLGRFLQLH